VSKAGTRIIAAKAKNKIKRSNTQSRYARHRFSLMFFEYVELMGYPRLARLYCWDIAGIATAIPFFP
jgi:hypothetical protein